MTNVFGCGWFASAIKLAGAMPLGVDLNGGVIPNEDDVRGLASRHRAGVPPA